MPVALARFLSFVGHPLLVLTYMLLLMLWINPYAFGAGHIGDQRSMLLLFYVGSTTFLIPALGVSLLKPLGMIRSLEMHDKQERIGPYIITGVFYLWMFKNFSSTGIVPQVFARFVLGATIGLFFAFFVNIFYKISAHASGMGGMVTMMLILAFDWAGLPCTIGPYTFSLNILWATIVILAGLVGMARLRLGAHSLAELGMGYAAGSIAVWLASVII